MKFTVLWIPEAEQELTEIWLASDKRGRVTEAAKYIDHVLRSDPDEIGESRDLNRRILIAPPLAVLFRIDSEDRKVYVVAAWSFQERR